MISLFTALGCACEQIKQDYGEDLLIQPVFEDEVQHFRILAQVKGTKNPERLKNKNGNLEWKVSYDHMLKWSRSSDLVIIALWDLKSNIGYYTYPSPPKATPFNTDYDKETIKLEFSATKLLNEESGRSIIWTAWGRHFERLIVVKNDIINDDAASSERKNQAEHDRLILGVEMLLLLGAAIANPPDLYINPKLYELYQNAKDSEIIKKDEDEEGARLGAVILSLLYWASEKAMGPLSSPVLICMTDAFDYIILNKEAIREFIQKGMLEPTLKTHQRRSRKR
ncbi:DUF4365 domain-containing protein [Corallococcus macrosporus]|uniref:DUF4365 domain-containing protein n=1 Tax=Corallococcus macrosporus TaxID=35 RepID=A0ABS3D617_9BACT|nr:DUF4365 domain-containing protein [Corallococcus macrosporus]